MLKTQPFNATDATNMKKELETACFNFYVSNAYCEGVARTDYTANILGANATADATGWGVKNMTIRTDKAGWKNPKTNETDKVVYGVTSEWYQTNGTTKEASILKQVLNGLPAGDYVLSMTMMGSTNLEVYVFFNAELIGMARTIGTSGGGKYGAGWNDYVFHFTKADNTDMPLQLQCKPETNYKDWYVDNFRLYLLNNGTVGIQTVSPETTSSDAVYDLQGRRVAQPGKGLYIINNKKLFN